MIEVLVSMSIFSLVMLVATGSVFSIVQANKKTHSLKSVMTNLNFALESMTRDIRLGSNFICNNETLKDCPDGGSEFEFIANRNINGDGVTDSNDRIVYKFANNTIYKKILGGNSNENEVPIIAPDITVTSLKFYVVGAGSSDTKQPKVIMSIQGYAGSEGTKSEFNIQSMVSQRAIDS